MKNLDSDKMMDGPSFAGNLECDSAKWVEIDGTMKYEVKFRFHRGGLRESLATTIKVYSYDELLQAINKEYDNPKYFESLSFEYIGIDSRINQTSYYVIGKRADQDSRVVGMSNGEFNKEKSVSESISDFKKSLKPGLLKFEKHVLNPLGFKLKEKYR
ncbi:MAG: hypothetical protein VYB38_14395 [Bacteroidota bacterium]|nr:hypothetical protein [Bacteroidota bacterium]MEE3149297.1 hypothetical protein [Bacteroidota bacterium]MEE3224425.1 hypothetical protein [Bacteroidota bacterium]MEE3244145.1 hypothetical protein [Bacteroidota bacterium]